MSKGGSCRSRITSNDFQIGPLRLAQRDVIADLVAHIHRLHGRKDLAAALRQLVRGVIGQPVPARLGLEHQRESGIAADIDPLDRVHLDGNVKGHRSLFFLRILRTEGMSEFAKTRG